MLRTTSQAARRAEGDRKSTRLNSSHTVIYTLSLHDALPIFGEVLRLVHVVGGEHDRLAERAHVAHDLPGGAPSGGRSEEHTSELQSHRDLHSFPTRRSSDLRRGIAPRPCSGW